MGRIAVNYQHTLQAALSYKIYMPVLMIEYRHMQIGRFKYYSILQTQPGAELQPFPGIPDALMI